MILSLGSSASFFDFTAKFSISRYPSCIGKLNERREKKRKEEKRESITCPYPADGTLHLTGIARRQAFF
jgi:hypothetical protein